MAKTKEELNKLKEQYKELTEKLKELSDEELKIVTGGIRSIERGLLDKDKGERKDVYFECVCGVYFTNEQLYLSHIKNCNSYKGNH